MTWSRGQAVQRHGDQTLPLAVLVVSAISHSRVSTSYPEGYTVPPPCQRSLFTLVEES